MGRIINRLDLNRTPQNCQDNSLVFAQNIKLGKDGVLTKDDGLSNISGIPNGYSIVGVIPYNTCFFILLYNNTTHTSAIYKYTEYENTLTQIHSGWKYSNGKIDGNVVQTLNGDIILSIAEYFDEDDENYKLIPLKFININKSTDEDNETIYSQLPEVPIINLNIVGKYPNPIPNGVYQFFIRYEIYKDCYTEWFPASKECFAGSPQYIDKTQLGTVKYIDTSYQSSESFIFSIDKVYNPDVNPYKKFQVGFVLSTDDSIVARSWKLFDINTTTIHFDYDKDYIEELDIQDVIKPAFDLYNVKNITMFKNKQYISNFVETDYNPDFVDISKKIKVTYAYKDGNVSSKYELIEDDYEPRGKDFEIDDVHYYSQIQKENESSRFIGRDCVLNIFNNCYTEYKAERISRAPIPYEKPYNSGAKFNDYGISFEALNSNNYVVRANSLDDLLSNSTYGKYAQAIKDKFEGIATEDVKFVIMDNHLYSSNNNYDEDDDTGIYNAMLTERFAFGKVGLNGSADDLGNGNVKHIEGTDIDTLEYLGIAEYIQHISAYSKLTDEFYITAHGIGNYTPRYVPSSFNNTNVKTYYSSVLYSIVYINGQLICRQLYFKFSPRYNSIYDDLDLTDYSTLIPNQEYKLYIHYVKPNGETTNGYIINNGEPLIVSEDNVKNIKYPKFDLTTLTSSDLNLIKSKGYVSYFISIQHYKNKVIYPINWLYCLELDAKLYYGYKIYAKVKNRSADITDVPLTYRSSNDNSGSFRYFGNTGLLDLELPSGLDLSNIEYIYLEYENDSDDVQLVKATPYYILQNNSVVDNYKDLTLLGYLCNIYRIEMPDDSLFYGAETVYQKEIDDNHLVLKALKYDDDNKYYYQTRTSNPTLIYSNFNLNYLGLTEDGMSMIVPQIKSVGETVSDNKWISWYNYNSLQLSSFYKLQAMYHNYTRKSYSKYNKDDVIKFDNTIRCSELVGDEEKLYRYSFNIVDYYHIPSNKGKIVNLFAVGTSLIVHTEDSMYKFNGTATFNSNQEDEIQTTETELFNAGINEIFGSLYGYAGLQNKDNSLITEAGYFFYDEHSKTIYIYSGEGKLKILSDIITKLINHMPISRVDFASDLYNDRIFININFKQGNIEKYVTLSYNLASNSLISTHTFDYDYTFNTKVNCYFVDKINNEIYKIDRDIIGYGDLVKDNSVFYKDNKINGNYPSIIDVVYVGNYEFVKILNSISWTCEEVDVNSFDNQCPTIESKDITYNSDYVRIYTDSCDTGNIDTTITGGINKFGDNKKPYYERGVWNFNYFRNIRNLLNNPNLPAKLDNLGNYVSDETTLLYGKYFVARFIFDIAKQFKLENISFKF